MTDLRVLQSIFLLNVAKLIIWAFDNGFQLTAGELMRSQEQQDIYYNDGRSKVVHSRHQDRLAIDLNLFIKGVYQTNRAAYEPLALYWKSLDEDNIAGYDWGWDANHFEMKK